MSSAPHSVRVCPRCCVEMDHVALVEARSGIVDVCSGCGGAFFDFHDGLPTDLSRALTERNGRPKTLPPIDYRQTPVCPECDREMQVAAYLDEGPELARCGGCLAVFATPRHLRELGVFEQIDTRDLWQRIGDMFRHMLLRRV